MQKRPPGPTPAVSECTGTNVHREAGPRLACMIGGRGKPRPYKDAGQSGGLVGAHLCVRPCTEVACVQRADTSVGPYRGSNVDLYFDGVAIVWFAQRAGHAPPLQNERSVTWRSGLFIFVTLTNTNMRIPGPGPQARCGKGVWSPEDQGDRCRVPRSFGPSGAGREQR